MKFLLDKIGSLGSLGLAAACPACFPQLAAVGAVFGLGALASYEGQIFFLTKVLVAVAMVGYIWAYRAHRRVWVLGLGVGGGVLFFLGLYVFGSEALIYVGFASMLVASIADLWMRWRARHPVVGSGEV